MAKYKIVALPKRAEYMELDLTPEEIQEYAKGGYIIEDISVPTLNQMQDGGIVQLDGYRFKKDDSGNWFYESGAPVTDRALAQRLTYESKPVGSPVVQNAPRPRVNQAVWENASGTSQKNAIAREKQLQTLKASPVLADQEKAAQIEQQRAASEAEYMNQLRQSSQYEQPLDMMDWLWGATAIGPTIAPAAWAAAETAGTAAMPYINAAFNTIPGQLVSSGLAADAIVNRLYPSAGKIQEGRYGEAAEDIATGILDLAGANMLSPMYKGAKATASELAKFLGTEEGLLSNAYKYNPWAFKPNPEAGYRMIGGKEGYLDAIRSGEIRPTDAYDVAHFNMGQPLNPNRLSAEELIQAGSPGGYKGPYMAEMEQGTWQRMSDAFSNNPEMQEQFKLLGKDKNVWQHPLFGNIKVDDPRLKLYKEHWLKGYKEVPKELPGSPNSSFSIFPKKPVPLQGYDLSKGQAYKTIYSNPEHNWHNQSYKDLYDQMLRDLEQQKKLSDELAGFDPLDKMNNSAVSNEAYKNLLMGEDLKWKIDDDLTTPRIPFNKSGQRAEGVKFHSKVEYKPMDPKTKESINVLNNIERGTNRIPEANQAGIDINALMDDMTPLDFVKKFRMNLKDPKTGKAFTINQINKASPQQINGWRKQIYNGLMKPVREEIEIQNLSPNITPNLNYFNYNKVGGQINNSRKAKLSKFID